MFRFVAIAVLALNFGLVHNCVISGAKSCENKMEAASSSYEAKAVEESSNVVGACGGSSSYQKSEKEIQQASSYAASSSSYSSETVDLSIIEKAFSECSLIESCQRDLYLNYLRKCGPNDITYWQNLIEKLNCKKQFLSSSLQFDVIYNKLHPIYEKLVAEQFYVANCNWADKLTILEQYKSNLLDILDIVKEEELLYGPLNYCLNTNLELLPMLCGIYDVVLQEQQSYYKSASSSSSVTEVAQSTTRSTSSSVSSSSSSSSSTVEVDVYQNALSECSSIQQVERDLYIQYLSEMSQEHLVLLNNYWKYLSCKEQFLTQEMISDFSIFNEKIRSIYDLLVKEQIYVQGCSWMDKVSVFQKCRSDLEAILNCLNKDCWLYKSLCWCLEDKYMHYLPIVIGLNNVICSSQSSYFSSSTSYSSSTTQEVSQSSSSSCGAVKTCGC